MIQIPVVGQAGGLGYAGLLHCRGRKKRAFCIRTLGVVAFQHDPGYMLQALNECTFLISLLPSVFFWGLRQAPGQRQQSFWARVPL